MEKTDLKILIVDDEQDVLEALKTHLELDGFQVETALSGEEALTCVEQKAYHIVFSDINMPVMDGIELLKRIKKSRGEVLVVMITAYSSLHKVWMCRACGAYDYLLKPFRDPDEIQAVVTRAAADLQRWEELIRKTGGANDEKGP